MVMPIEMIRCDWHVEMQHLHTFTI